VGVEASDGTSTKAAPRAFISHNRANKAQAEELARALRQTGVDAWFDAWEIGPGVATDDWVIQFHRVHRDPESQSVRRARFFARTDSAGFAQGHCARV
jgi:hypothetical protein